MSTNNGPGIGKVWRAEDLPKAPALDPDAKAPIRSACHHVGLLRAGWWPKQRIVMLFCGECGKGVMNLKIESQSKLIVPNQ